MSPFYSYLCPECAHTFDASAPVRDRHRIPCEKCFQLARLVPAAPGIAFRGSGFTPKSGRGRTK